MVVIPVKSVSGDSAYSDAHELRTFVKDMGKWYYFEVHCDSHVWTADPGSACGFG
jgi:uncharacterized protein YchJ